MKEVDIVDVHDNIVEKKDIATAIKEGLLHRFVVVLVCNPDGEVFVCRRMNGAFSGSWQASVCDNVWGGEVARDTAFRILHGVLGVHATPKQMHEVIKFGFHEENLRLLVTVFMVKDYKIPIDCDAEEVSDDQWWSFEKLKDTLDTAELTFHPVMSHVLKDVEKMKESAKDFV